MLGQGTKLYPDEGSSRVGWQHDGYAVPEESRTHDGALSHSGTSSGNVAWLHAALVTFVPHPPRGWMAYRGLASNSVGSQIFPLERLIGSTT